jgi:hypothetical protein
LASATVLSASAAVGTGCGGDDSKTTGGDAGGGSDATGDTTVNDSPSGDAKDTGSTNDAGVTIGDGAAVHCPNQPCGNNLECCLVVGGDAGGLQCLSSCPDGSAPIACTGPQNCTQSTPYCCDTIHVGAGNPPNCPFNSVQTSCTASCQTQLQLSCPGTETARLCQHSGDCASDPNNPNCCQFTQNNVSATFCVDNLTKIFAVQCL